MTTEPTNENLTRWLTVYTAELKHRFDHDPSYATVVKQTTPREYAERYTQALRERNASKDGKAVIATCKKLGIRNTYQAIEAYLNGEYK
jgi:hypothetical protein